MTLQYDTDELQLMTTEQLKEIQTFLGRSSELLNKAEQVQALSTLEKIDEILHARMPKA